NEIEHEWGSMDRFDPDIDKNEDIVNMVKAIESDESSIEEKSEKIRVFFKQEKANMEDELYDRIKQEYKDGNHEFVIDAFKVAFIPTMSQRLKDFENKIVSEDVIMPTFASESEMAQFFK